MMRSVVAHSSLLSGMGILLIGSGLLGLLLSLRGADEGFSDLTIGLLMSGFYLGYIIGAWVCPKVISRIGHIRAFTVFAACSAVLALAHALLVHPGAWWVLRVASGIALIGLFMVIESWLNARAHEDRGQVFSIYITINLIAVALGPLLVAGYGPQDMASFALVAILFCLGLIPIAMTPLAQPELPQSERLSLQRLYERAPVGAVGALFSGLVVAAFWSLNALFARALGMDDATVALLILITALGGACLQLPIGWLSDHFDRRLIMLASSLGMIAAALGMSFVQPSSIGVLFGCAFVFGGFAFSLYSLAVAQTHDRLEPSEALEGTRSLLLLHGIGAVAGPILTGLAMQVNEQGYVLMIALIGSGLATFTALRIWLDEPVAADDKTVFAMAEQTSEVALEFDPRANGADTETINPQEAWPESVHTGAPDATALNAGVQGAEGAATLGTAESEIQNALDLSGNVAAKFLGVRADAAT